MKIIVAAIAGLGALLFGSKAAAAPAQAPAPTPKKVDPFNAWDSLIQKYARQYNVPFDWIKAIMMNESDLGRAASVKRGLADPTNIEASKSSDGKSWGLMQLTVPTARMFENVTAVELNDPETSIRLGARYLAWLLTKTPSPYTQEEFVIRAYNGGPGFRSTVAGQRDTPAYYARWKQNFKKIQDAKA